MIQFIVAVFVMLAAAFWVLSGGSDFVPETRPEPSIAAAEAEAPTIAAPVAASQPEPEPQPEMEPEPEAELQPETEPEPEAEPLPDAAPEPQAEPQPAATAQPAFTAPVIIEAPAQEPEAAPEPEPAPAPTPNADLRRVDADRVNLRSGPSTDYRVLDTLTRDTQVEVLSIDTLGSEPWAQLLVVETGLEGFMAIRFLTAQ